MAWDAGGGVEFCWGTVGVVAGAPTASVRSMVAGVVLTQPDVAMASCCRNRDSAWRARSTARASATCSVSCCSIAVWRANSRDVFLGPRRVGRSLSWSRSSSSVEESRCLLCRSRMRCRLSSSEPSAERWLWR